MLLVEERFELLALHRVLMEAKFHPDPDSRDIAASPWVSKLAHRVLDALIESESQEAAERWKAWRRSPESGRFWSVATRQARGQQDWESRSALEKLELAKILLAPFEASEAQLYSFVDEVDASP